MSHKIRSPDIFVKGFNPLQPGVALKICPNWSNGCLAEYFFEILFINLG